MQRLHLDAKIAIARTSIAAWNALMRGQRHRIGGPAITYADCRMKWYERNQLHHIGGPAITYADGGEEWYERGQRHRIGGPAITCSDGTKRWYERGNLIDPPM